jgi:hypothetical protein
MIVAIQNEKIYLTDLASTKNGNEKVLILYSKDLRGGASFAARQNFKYVESLASMYKPTISSVG